MNWIARTLWDLISRAEKPRTPDAVCAPAGHTAVKPKRAKREPVRATPMQQRYDALVVEMKRTYGVRVRKWRSSSSGCAWEVKYDNGSLRRLIESPYPKGPMSCAIFLHEIGHHAIGFRTYKPRCLEEYHAWKWALATMEQRGLNVTDAVRKRMHDSLRYAVAKARRRGLQHLPAELVEYLEAEQK